MATFDILQQRILAINDLRVGHALHHQLDYVARTGGTRAQLTAYFKSVNEGTGLSHPDMKGIQESIICYYSVGL